MTLHAWNVPQIGPDVCRSAKDDQLFRELAEVLKRHHALDRFGVTLLHKHFEIGHDEALLETTDVEAREQRLQVVKRDAMKSLGAIETSWKLGPDGEALWGCICVPDPKTGQCSGHRVVR